MSARGSQAGQEPPGCGAGEQRPGSSWPEAGAGCRSPTPPAGPQPETVPASRVSPPRLCVQMWPCPLCAVGTIRAPALRGGHVQVPGRQHVRLILALPLVLCDLGQATPPLCASVSLPGRRSLVLTCIQQAQDAARSRGTSRPLCSLLSPCPLGSAFFSPPQRHSSLWVPAGSCPRWHHGSWVPTRCQAGRREAAGSARWAGLSTQWGRS